MVPKSSPLKGYSDWANKVDDNFTPTKIIHLYYYLKSYADSQLQIVIESDINN